MPICAFQRRLQHFVATMNDEFASAQRHRTRILVTRLSEATVGMLAHDMGQLMCLWVAESMPCELQHKVEVVTAVPNRLILCRPGTLNALKLPACDGGALVMAVWHIGHNALSSLPISADSSSNISAKLSEKRLAGAKLRALESSIVADLATSQLKLSGETRRCEAEKRNLEYVLEVDGTPPNRALTLRVSVPPGTLADLLDVEVSMSDVDIQCEAANPLKVVFPFDVDEDNVSAQFDRGASQLTLKLSENET